MGCLECSRAGCPNIMSERYSYEYGYLCSDCFEELVQKDYRNIKSFLGTEPDNDEDARRAYYGEIFPLRK